VTADIKEEGNYDFDQSLCNELERILNNDEAAPKRDLSEQQVHQK